MPRAYFLTYCHLLSISSVVCVAVMMFSSPAFGESSWVVQADQGESTEQLVEEVLVHADASFLEQPSDEVTRFNLPLKELPFNVQVIDSRRVRHYSVVDQRDLLERQAGVSGKNIRGFGIGEYYRDSFLHLSDVPSFLIERVSIIKGPNSLVAGPVSTGGAINVNTKSAALTQSYFETSLGHGSASNLYDDWLWTYDGQQIFAGEHFAVRAVAGAQRVSVDAMQPRSQVAAFMPSLFWQPTGQQAVRAKFYAYENKNNRLPRPFGAELAVSQPEDTVQIPLAEFTGEVMSNLYPSNALTRESLTDFELHYDFAINDEVQFKSALNRHSRFFHLDNATRPAIGNGYFFEIPDVDYTQQWPQIGRRLEQLELDNEVYQGSAYFLFQRPKALRISMGMEFFEQQQLLDIARPRINMGTGDVLQQWFDVGDMADIQAPFMIGDHDAQWDTVFKRERRTQQQRLLLNAFYPIMAGRARVQWSLVVNRIVIDETPFDVSGFDVAQHAHQPLPEKTLYDEVLVLPQIGGVWYLDDQETLALYGNYSDSQLPELNGPDFELSAPVTSGRQYEAGIRCANCWRDGFSAASGLFRIEQELVVDQDKQVTIAYGLDVDVAYTSPWGLATTLRMALVDSEVTEGFTPEAEGLPSVNQVGQKVSLQLDYRLFEPWPITVGAVATYTDERVRPAYIASREPLTFEGRALYYQPETRMDIFANYATEHIDINLGVKNLWKESAVVPVVPSVPWQGGIDEDGDAKLYAGERVISVALRYRFGIDDK